MSPVALLSEGDYGIGIYSNAPFFIAEGPYGSGFSAEPQFWSRTEGQPPPSTPRQQAELHLHGLCVTDSS